MPWPWETTMKPVQVAVLAVAVAWLASGRTAAADEPVAVAKGRQLAEGLCAVCHMQPGQGEKEGPRGIPSFKAVANRPRQTTADVAVWLRSVPPMMPNHHLTHDEIDALAAFIMSLRGAGPS